VVKARVIGLDVVAADAADPTVALEHLTAVDDLILDAMPSGALLEVTVLWPILTGSERGLTVVTHAQPAGDACLRIAPRY
jgi:hypothetical protein